MDAQRVGRGDTIWKVRAKARGGGRRQRSGVGARTFPDQTLVLSGQNQSLVWKRPSSDTAPLAPAAAPGFRPHFPYRVAPADALRIHVR